MDAPKSTGLRLALVRYLQRALAVVLLVVTHAFLWSVPNSPSTALGFAYGASAVILVVAAWQLMSRTMED